MLKHRLQAIVNKEARIVTFIVARNLIEMQNSEIGFPSDWLSTFTGFEQCSLLLGVMSRQQPLTLIVQLDGLYFVV